MICATFFMVFVASTFALSHNIMNLANQFAIENEMFANLTKGFVLKDYSFGSQQNGKQKEKQQIQEYNV